MLQHLRHHRPFSKAIGHHVLHQGLERKAIGERLPVDLHRAGLRLKLLDRLAFESSSLVQAVHVVKQNSQGEYIPFAGPNALLPNLGGHVAGRAHDTRGAFPEIASQAEVDYNDVRILPVGVSGDHHIGLFDVAVHGLLAMQVHNASTSLLQNARQPILVQRYTILSCSLSACCQVTSKVRLADHVDIHMILKNFIQPGDLRMVQRCEEVELLDDVLHRRIGTALIVKLDYPLQRGRLVCGQVNCTLSTLA
mmetsp:Transcript_73164/g.171550  ORF Transcript_73164/g.171550 Transcript_73164/m.171550 type:complete len:251 (-) Transcript_73164:564-1316(-)